MTDIKLNNVSFSYPGDFLALDNINIEISSGENVAIVGQNGAGKTTAVKLMNNLLKPTVGDVLIGEMNTKDYTTAQISKIVGYVFQNPDDQIFHSTVIEEVEFGPKELGFDEEKVKDLVEKALKLTNMDKFRDENPYNLPLSTRKFVTIASILAMDTDVIIFDEPTAGQDLLGNQRLSKIIERLIEKGKTLITITHDMEFVVQNFNRVIVMANKKVIREGTPSEVFWDFQSLEEAKLKQPTISHMSRKLGISKQITYTEELIELIVENIRDKEQ